MGSDGKVSTYTPLSQKNPLAKLPAFRTPAGELDIAAMALNLAAQLDLASGITALNAMSAAVNREAPWEDAAFDPLLRLTGPRTTREADTFTVQTWLDLNMNTADARTLISNAITGVLGVSPAAASLLHFLFMLKTFQSSFANASGFAFANNFVNMIGSEKGRRNSSA